MKRHPPKSTRTDTPFPYPTLFRSARRTACINVIDEHADRAFRARIEGPRADTANIELRARGAEAAEIEGRNPRREIFGAEDAELLDLLAAKGGDRDRDILNPFLADRKSTRLHSSH